MLKNLLLYSHKTFEKKNISMNVPFIVDKVCIFCLNKKSCKNIFINLNYLYSLLVWKWNNNSPLLLAHRSILLSLNCVRNKTSSVNFWHFIFVSQKPLGKMKLNVVLLQLGWSSTFYVIFHPFVILTWILAGIKKKKNSETAYEILNLFFLKTEYMMEFSWHDPIHCLCFICW